MSLAKENFIKDTTSSIQEYIYTRYGLDVNYLELKEVIDNNVGFIYDTVEELAESA